MFTWVLRERGTEVVLGKDNLTSPILVQASLENLPSNIMREIILMIL